MTSSLGTLSAVHDPQTSPAWRGSVCVGVNRLCCQVFLIQEEFKVVSQLSPDDWLVEYVFCFFLQWSTIKSPYMSISLIRGIKDTKLKGLNASDGSEVNCLSKQRSLSISGFCWWLTGNWSVKWTGGLVWLMTTELSPKAKLSNYHLICGHCLMIGMERMRS